MALVISRKDMESVWIGEGIKVTVLMGRGNQVKLSFEAPEDVQILREELVDHLLLPEH